jgi:hypothetical protein
LESPDISLRPRAARYGIASETTIHRKCDNPKDPWRRSSTPLSPPLLPGEPAAVPGFPADGPAATF